MRRITVLLALILAALLVGSVGADGAVAALERTTDGTTTAAREGTAQEGSTDAHPGSFTIQPYATLGGVITAWGRNQQGQLGDGTNSDSNVPLRVRNLSGVTAVSAGGFHSLALKNDGTVAAWGQDPSGQLGNGPPNSNTNLPVQVSNLSGVTAVSGGSDHSLALKNDGTVWAWGENASGQLGNGNTGTDSNVPVQVSNLSGVTAIAAGGEHSLALKNDGTVWAWGKNFDGELGNGTSGPGNTSNVPVQVTDPTDPSTFLQNVTAISGGALHSLALKKDGTVAAWGANLFGQLGNGTDGNTSNVPVQVSNLSKVTAIDGGGTHSLAVKKIKKKKKLIPVVMAWGSNGAGQLGNGNTGTDSNVPVQVSNLSRVTAISGGFSHSLALKKDGTVAAWGSNSSGQLGNGTSGTGTDSNVPIQVSDLSGVTSVAGGTLHSLAK